MRENVRSLFDQIEAIASLEDLREIRDELDHRLVAAGAQPADQTDAFIGHLDDAITRRRTELAPDEMAGNPKVPFLLSEIAVLEVIKAATRGARR